MKDDWDPSRQGGAVGTVLLLTPDHVHAQDRLEDVYRDQLDGALSRYKEVVRLDCLHFRAVLQLAVTHEHAHRYRAASTGWRALTARRGG
jgi:hypothetical protein